jgi:hypothetical protein
MPSVFTIEGTDVGELPTRSKKGTALAGTDDDNCKWVKNPRTGCEVKLCFVGKAQSRTGWKFEKGSTRCPTRR